MPVVYATNILLLAALTFLLLRRLGDPYLRYISLPADYVPLLLILSIAGTGVLMRYFFKTDIVAVKELAVGLVTFAPTIPAGDLAAVLRPPVPGVGAVRLLPVLQAHPHGGRVPFAHPQPGEHRTA